jgi:hypothetical protein
MAAATSCVEEGERARQCTGGRTVPNRRTVCWGLAGSCFTELRSRQTRRFRFTVAPVARSLQSAIGGQ